MLILYAKFPKGNKTEKNLPNNEYRGYPGLCATPSVIAVVINSPLSPLFTDGEVQYNKIKKTAVI
jgi:hypothetical protein